MGILNLWAALGALVGLVGGPGPATALPAGPADSASLPITITGTVLSADAGASRIELISGVGMALRTVKVRCGAGTVIRAGEKSLSMDSLRRGDRIRVVCRRLHEEYEVIRIEVLPPPVTNGGAR